MRIVLTAILLAASVVATVLSLVTQPFYDHAHPVPLVLFTAGLWILFALSILTLRAVRTKAAVILIIAGSVGIGGAAMAGPPNTSTDSARYAWDGIVASAGVSPYEYAATSSKLRYLRPAWLFPAGTPDALGYDVCTGSRIETSHEPGSSVVVCTALNRGPAHTIYPPSSELLFNGIRFLVGPNAQYWPMQLAGLLMGLAITGLLLRGLWIRGMDVRWAALWAWCPLWATEGVTNSHVDMLGALFLLIATLYASSAKPWRAGVALGISIAAKLIPVIGAPALLRGRAWWKIILGAVATFLLLYVPYILSSGIKVLGYLPKYLNEEGYDTGSRFALIGWVIHGKGSIIVAVVLFLLLAFLVWRKSDPLKPWLGEVVMIGVTLLIVSPRYPWYGLLLVPMIAMTGRWEWLTVTLAITARGLIPHIAVLRWAELIAIVIVVAVTIWRAGPGWPRRVIAELRHPWRAPLPVPPEPAPAAHIA